MKSTDSVKTYLYTIRTIPLLTREEEVEIARCIEECRVDIVRKLSAAGALNQEVMELRQSLTRPDAGRGDAEDHDSYLLPDDEGNDHEILNILDEIINLSKSGRDTDMLLSRILEADRLTGIIEKTVHRLRTDEQAAERGVKELLSSINDIEKRLQEAKNRFVRANLRLAADIARRYSMNDVQMMDLIQEGNIGLMRAVEKFDYRKGYRFATYATWWIRQYIIKSSLMSGTSLNIPAHILSAINKMIRTSVSFMQESGREPSIEELSEKMGLPVEKIKGLIDMMMHKEVSLDAPAGEDGEGTLSDFIGDKGQASPADDIISDEMMKELNEALSVLSPKEEKVLRMKFGIGETKRYSMDEIARKLSINRERVRQIEAKAMRKLRHPKASGSLKIFLD